MTLSSVVTYRRMILCRHCRLSRPRWMLKLLLHRSPDSSQANLLQDSSQANLLARCLQDTAAMECHRSSSSSGVCLQAVKQVMANSLLLKGTEDMACRCKATASHKCKATASNLCKATASNLCKAPASHKCKATASHKCKVMECRNSSNSSGVCLQAANNQEEVNSSHTASEH